MRKSFMSLMVLGLASAASAQTVDLTPFVKFRVDDGSYENAWKVNFPSTASDWFNNDFGGLVTGVTAAAYGIDTFDTAGIGGAYAELSWRTSSGPGTPNVSATGLIAAVAAPTVVPPDGLNSVTGYSMPATVLGSDVHACINWVAGDSNLWVGADSNGGSQNRSYFTLNNYSTAAIPFFTNWSMLIGGFPAGSDGTLLINGATSTAVLQKQQVCMTFTACAPGVTSALFLASPFFLGPLLPIPFTITGGFFGGPLPNQWTFCVTTDCTFPTGGPFGFVAFYLDVCDLKPNGKPKAKVSTTAFLTLNPNPSCAGCFGQRDDGILDSVIWKVQNPAGSSDFFNVDQGSPASTGAGANVNTITGVEIASWDFCGFGPSWAQVGIYPQLAPGTPDIANPFGLDANPTMAPGAADWSYPATFYDVPDFAAGSTTAYETAAQWQTGDSCTWMGSDTDGADSTACTTFPSTTSFSYFTMSAYSTGGNGPFSPAHWMQKADWQ